MAVDRRRGLQAAERLLKQGKVQAALSELQRVSESAPDDLLTLNRLGDLLHRQGRNAEAIEYYRKIADQFATGGFVSKATAIHKKILRIDPQFLESLIKLGDLYLAQNFHGEAATYLLHAANQYLQGQEFEAARKIYERLGEANPSDYRHRVRIAETRAAEGNLDAAVEELTRLARSLADSGSLDEAEKIFERAAELHPESVEPLLGAAACLAAQDRTDEAIQRLEAAINQTRTPAVAGELAFCYLSNGREDDGFALLHESGALEIPSGTWRRLLERGVRDSRADRLWECLDPALEASGDQQLDDALNLLEQLVEVEAGGHIPALRRLYELQEKRGDGPAALRSLEMLVAAYRGQSRLDEAAEWVERLNKLAPKRTALETPTEAAPASPPAASITRPATAPPSAPVKPSADLPVEAEAPAVPLNKGDEEFVAGRLTQAEVLEKYGLHEQALEQVAEVTHKFPGHVAAQEARVKLLRATDASNKLPSALAGLALARRASGEHEAAVEAANEAVEGSLDAAKRRVLEQCGLVASEAPAETAPGSDSVTDPAVAAEPAGLSVDDGAGEIEFVIDSGRADTEPITPAAPPKPAPPATATAPEATRTETTPAGGSRTRTPTPDMLEEIQQCAREGALEDARKRIAALRTLGYASEAMDALEQGLESTPEAAAAAQEPSSAPPAAAATPEPSVAPPVAETPETTAESAPEPVESPAIDLDATVEAAADDASTGLADVELDATTDPPEVAATEVPDPAGSDETSFADVAAAFADQPEETEAAAEASAPEEQAPGEMDADLKAIAEALEDELFEDDLQDAPVVPEEESESLDEIFSTFKAAVKEQVSDEDFQTHYDLGIGYKEMGLIDEAIDAFRLVIESPTLSRQAHAMIAMCQDQQGETEAALGSYRAAIAAANGDEVASIELRYDLAGLLARTGDRESALTEFRALAEIDAAFRDVSQQIADLESQVEG